MGVIDLLFWNVIELVGLFLIVLDTTVVFVRVELVNVKNVVLVLDLGFVRLVMFDIR